MAAKDNFVDSGLVNTISNIVSAFSTDWVKDNLEALNRTVTNIEGQFELLINISEAAMLPALENLDKHIEEIRDILKGDSDEEEEGEVLAREKGLKESVSTPDAPPITSQSSSSKPKKSGKSFGLGMLGGMFAKMVGIGAIIALVGPIVIGFFEGLWEKIQERGWVDVTSTILEKIKGLFVGLLKAFGFEEAGKWLEEISIKEKMESMVSSLSQFFEDIDLQGYIDLYGEYLGNLVDGIMRMWEGVKALFGGDFEGFFTQFGGGLGDIVTSGINSAIKIAMKIFGFDKKSIEEFSLRDKIVEAITMVMNIFDPRKLKESVINLLPDAVKDALGLTESTATGLDRIAEIDAELEEARADVDSAWTTGGEQRAKDRVSQLEAEKIVIQSELKRKKMGTIKSNGDIALGSTVESLENAGAAPNEVANAQVLAVSEAEKQIWNPRREEMNKSLDAIEEQIANPVTNIEQKKALITSFRMQRDIFNAEAPEHFIIKREAPNIDEALAPKDKIKNSGENSPVLDRANKLNNAATEQAGNPVSVNIASGGQNLSAPVTNVGGDTITVINKINEPSKSLNSHPSLR